jgi:signal transduction histidine kinase
MAGSSPQPEPGRTTEHALVELARLPAEASLETVFRTACELSAEALEVERVGIWLFIDDHTVLRCANLYERSKQEHSEGAVLQVADFPTYFSSLSIGRSVPAEIAAKDPATAELAAEYLAPLGISSMLDAGLFVDGVMVGVVCHEHVGPPRHWEPEARDFVIAVAEAIALRLQAAEARELRTAFQRQQRRLAAQAKVSAMEELTAGIAHDFKNLLMTVRIYARLLSQRADLPPDARDQAAEIVMAVDRGAELTRELMEFARPRFAPPAVTDLGAVTAEYLPMLRAVVGPHYEVKYTASAAAGHVLIDKSQFKRLLMNLTTNAREAMPEGGTIRIRLAPVRKRGKPRGAAPFVMVEVADAGTGIDEATLERVFEPYFTTKPKGTGLGLPIVQQIVDRVGGCVKVVSTPGRGTTVRMYFPSIRAGTGSNPKAAQQADG